MAEEATGGLSATEEPVIKETRPKTGGLTLGGTKGVSLEPEQSMEVRNRLLEMIRQREAERSGWGPILEGLMLPTVPEAQLATRVAEHNANKRQRDQDIFNMRLGVSQLESEDRRLAQARADALRNQQQFGALLTGGTSGAAPTSQEAGGPIATPQQVRSFAQNLNQDQAAALMMLYRQSPTEATKQLIQLTKKTDAEREADAAGLVGDERQAFLRVKLAGSGAFVPHDIRTPEGTEQQTPLMAARPPGPLSTAPSAYDRLTAPRPGALSTTTPPVVPREVLPATTAPAPVRAVPPATTTTTTTTTAPTGFKPGSKEDLRAREEQAKADIAVRQKAAEVPIAGATKESEKMGETSAAEQTVHAENVKLAPTNALISKQLETDIKAVPGLIGKLNKPTIFSTIMNLADKGVQVGNLGSVSIPGLKDAIIQLDPEVRKDPKKLEAYQRVVNNISKIGLEFARAVNKGMGAMSNYERSIVEQAVGDPTRMNANNLMMKAKALECDAKNAIEKDRLWTQMQKAGYDWSKFKKSPEYIDLERKQFYRTAKAMHLPDAKFPGDQ